MSSLGKRSRPPMKKTTSMTEITFDLGEQFNLTASPFPFPSPPQKSDHPFLSPRNYRRHNNSIDLQNSNNFLRVCSLCNRPLVPGRDIYMYRGDNGFCSEECRKKQMKQDERMEKCSFFATKKSAAVSSSSSSSSSAASVIPPPQISANGETVAAS